MFHSEGRISPEHFEALALAGAQKAFRARKIGRVAARPASRSAVVETLWNGKETRNTAEPGDWIVLSLTEDLAPMKDASGALNIYVIRQDRFPELYEADPSGAEVEDHGLVYRAKTVVSALAMPDGFDILAPWGERQRADSGYLIHSGDEVYGAHAEVFDRTYERLSP